MLDECAIGSSETDAFFTAQKRLRYLFYTGLFGAALGLGFMVWAIIDIEASKWIIAGWLDSLSFAFTSILLVYGTIKLFVQTTQNKGLVEDDQARRKFILLFGTITCLCLLKFTSLIVY